MHTLLNIIENDKFIFYGSVFSVVLIITTIIYAIFSYSHLPPLIPLFNQMPWGDARLGIKTQIFIPIIISLLTFFTNWIIESLLYEKIPLVARILSITTSLICFFSLLLTIRTIQLIV